jgi:hypothetical protein
MMTLKRFAALADSYGADLARWPDGVRGEAEAMLRTSAEARARLDEARTLDEAIAAAQAEDDALWGPVEQAAALARLRSGVEARIASSGGGRSMNRNLTGWAGVGGALVLALPLRWIGLATGGGLVVMAGVLIGALYTAAPAEPGGLMAMLQPAPIHMLTD